MNASSEKTFRFRTARVRGLGAPAWSLVWGRHAWHSLLCGSTVFGAGRNASATAPASLALVSGASPAGLRAWVAIRNLVGARVAFLPARSAQPESMPPCSFQHHRASATASHNKSMHTDTQVLAAARLRFPGAGDFRRYEGMALRASSGRTFRPRIARMRCLGVSTGSLFWGWHGRRSFWPRSKLVCAGRISRATAPASLAQAVGASLSGAQSFWVAANAPGGKVAF